LKEHVITRRNDLPILDNELTSAKHFDTYYYPFKTLPLLQSHLHPKFVIFNAGKKLTSLDPADFRNLTTDFPCLTFILSLYMAWIRNVLPSQLDDQTYAPLVVPEDDYISSNDDDSKDEDYNDT
jgi:hypothetical protein